MKIFSKLFGFIIIYTIIIPFILICDDKETVDMQLFKSFYYFKSDNLTVMKLDNQLKAFEVVNLGDKLKEIGVNDRISFYNIVVTSNESDLFVATYANPSSYIYKYSISTGKLNNIIKSSGDIMFLGLSKSGKYLIYNTDSEIQFYDIFKDKSIKNKNLDEELVLLDEGNKKFIVFKDNRIIYLDNLKIPGSIMYLPLLKESSDLILSTKLGYLKVDSYNYKTGEKKLFLDKGRFHCLIGLVKDRYLLYYQNPRFSIGESFPMYYYDLNTNKYFNMKANNKNSGWYLIP